MIDYRKVVAYKTSTSDYPTEEPFNPSFNYPEYPFEELSESNEIYNAVREIFRMLDLDKDRYNSSEWNPLGDLIKPGDKVTIKATLTNDINLSGDSPLAVITHGSVIRPLIDYSMLAKPSEIVICDGPIPRTSFEKVSELTGLGETINFFNHTKNGTLVKYVDLRDEVENPKDVRITRQIGDPKGYVEVDLGKDSELVGIADDHKSFGSVTSILERRSEPARYHNSERNVYSISKSLLDADVVIIVSKLKSHRKVGCTLGLKTAVGIDNKKYRLPHYRSGIDDMPHDFINKQIIRNYRKVKYSLATKFNYKCEGPIVDGNWFGNNTVWRIAVDLNRILFYADKEGVMHRKPQRKIFTVIDGIIGGDKFGPLAPREKKVGLIIAGSDLVAVDAIASTLMGFDYKTMPLIRNAFNANGKPISFVKPEEITVLSNKDRFKKGLNLKQKESFQFKPTCGWKNHIELQ